LVSKLGEKRKQGEGKEKKERKGRGKEEKDSIVCIERKGREKKRNFIFLLNPSSYEEIYMLTK
jgi:hypothetical protein